MLAFFWRRGIVGGMAEKPFYVYTALLGTMVLVFAQLLTVQHPDRSQLFAIFIMSLGIPSMSYVIMQQGGIVNPPRGTIRMHFMSLNMCFPFAALAACFNHFSSLACLIFLVCSYVALSGVTESIDPNQRQRRDGIMESLYKLPVIGRVIFAILLCALFWVVWFVLRWISD